MKYFNWKHGTKVTVGRSWGAKIISTTIECFATFVCVYIRMWWMCDRKRIIYLLFAAPLMLVQKKRRHNDYRYSIFFSLLFFSLPLAPPFARNIIKPIPLGYFICVSFSFLYPHHRHTYIHAIFHTENPFECMTFFSFYVLNCSSLMVNVWIETTLRSIRNRISKLNTHPSF